MAPEPIFIAPQMWASMRGLTAPMAVPSRFFSETRFHLGFSLARIHRKTTLGTVLEEARGCSSESGIMVLEQKTVRVLLLPGNKEHPIDAATEQSRPDPHRL